MTNGISEPADDVTSAVESNAFWYHTMEVRPGLTTPGWFDLRPVVDQLPWPDVQGKRCLDIGTYDGFLAFEMEKRGASEIVATDVASHEDWDWPPAVRAGGVEYLKQVAGEKGRGLEIAASALGSKVSKKVVNVYDLSPDRVGTFDVVVCGSLLLHLRDPFRALDAIRSVCAGHFMSCEQIELALSVTHRHTPLTSLAHIQRTQWHVPNLQGHRQMVRAAGFDIVRTIRPYGVGFGPAHPPPRGGPVRRLVTRLLIGRYGVPHSAILAKPASSWAPE